MHFLKAISLPLLTAVALIVVVCYAEDASARRNAGRYRLSDGTVVECGYVRTDRCGMTFKECSDGNERQCQQNVTKEK